MKPNYDYYSSFREVQLSLFKFLIFISISTLFAFKANAVCPVPTSFSATNITGSSALISWVASANFYDVRYRVKTPQGAWVVKSSTPTNKIITGLLGNTTYEVQVQGHCTGTPALSGYSTSFEFTTVTPCATPTNVSVSNIKSTSAILYWVGPNNSAFYFTRYRVASPQGAWVNATNSVSYKKLTNLLPSTTYDFEVATSCTNDPTASSYSATFQFTTCALLITDFSLTSSTNSISNVGVSCSTEPLLDTNRTVYLNNCQIITYIADTVLGHSLGNTTVCAAVAADVDSLSNPTYRYGQRSYTVTPTSNGFGQITLFFSQADFTNYNNSIHTIDYLDLPSSGNNSDPNILAFKIAHVDSGITTLLSPTLIWDPTFQIWYCTLNVNNVGGSYYFYTLSACTNVNVLNLSVSNTTGHATSASWTSVTNPVFGWYTLRYSVQGSGVWTTTGTVNNGVTSRLVQGFSPLTTYELQIRRHCSNLSAGPWSSSVVFTTPNTCWVPLNLNASNVTKNSAKLNWGLVTGSGFFYSRYKAVAATTWTTLTGTPNFKTLSGLTPSTPYEFQVATQCAGSTIPGPYSASSFFTTLAPRLANDLNSKEIERNLELYPNPTTDLVNLDLTTLKAAVTTIKIMDVSGRIVKQTALTSIEGLNSLTLDLQDLASGVYVLQILENNIQTHITKLEKK